MKNRLKNQYELLCKKYGKNEIEKLFGSSKYYISLISQHGNDIIGKEVSEYFRETKTHFYPED